MGMTELEKEVPDLLKGTIKIYIMGHFGVLPPKEEVDRLAGLWIKNPKLSLKEFMRGYRIEEIEKEKK